MASSSDFNGQTNKTNVGDNNTSEPSRFYKREGLQIIPVRFGCIVRDAKKTKSQSSNSAPRQPLGLFKRHKIERKRWASQRFKESKAPKANVDVYNSQIVDQQSIDVQNLVCKETREVATQTDPQISQAEYIVQIQKMKTKIEKLCFQVKCLEYELQKQKMKTSSSVLANVQEMSNDNKDNTLYNKENIMHRKKVANTTLTSCTEKEKEQDEYQNLVKIKRISEKGGWKANITYRNNEPTNKPTRFEVSDEDCSDKSETQNEESDESCASNGHTLGKKYVLKRRTHTKLVAIGFGYAKVPHRILQQIEKIHYTNATRKLLTAVFPRKVLATHSLTGRPSPAFPDKPAKMKLDSNLVNDIIQTVMEKCDATEAQVRSSITTKLADESKMYRQQINKAAKRKYTRNENCPPKTYSKV